MVGQRFGIRTVTSEVPYSSTARYKFRRYEVTCDCGTVRIMQMDAIKERKHCGCLNGTWKRKAKILS